MKRILKLTALTLCIAALCVSLCSCQYLDDAKAKSVYYTDDSRESFTFRGSIYQKIPTVSRERFIFDSTVYGYHVAAQDVPVLMTSGYGDLMVFNETSAQEAPAVIEVVPVSVDEESFISFRNAYDWIDDEKIYNIYAREDLYEMIVQKLEKAELSRYYTYTYSYDETVPWQGGTYVRQMLDADMTAAVDRTLREGALTDWNSLGSYEWVTIELYPCDDDMLITNGKTYHVITNSLDYYLCDDTDYRLYKASDDDFEVFRKLYKTQRDSVGVADIEWYAEAYGDRQREAQYPER